jgi:hypothetical protein
MLKRDLPELKPKRWRQKAVGIGEEASIVKEVMVFRRS